MTHGYSAHLDFSRAPAYVLEQSRGFDRPVATLATSLPAALGRACGAEGKIDAAANAWRAKIPRPRALYDACEVAGYVTPGKSDMTSVVRIVLTFEGSAHRVGAFVMLTTSVIGLPVAYAWRAHSLRRARAFAAHVFTTTWETLEATTTAPYR